MKVIFLDIDGVLNDRDTFIRTHDVLKRTGFRLGNVDENRVKLLSDIIKATDAKIVMTSAWAGEYMQYINRINDRDDYSANVLELHRLFTKYNIDVDYFTARSHGDYGNGIYRTRGDEIRKCLHDIMIERFVILDDDSFPDFFWLKDYVIKSSFEKGGLDKEHVKQAIAILNKEDK